MENFLVGISLSATGALAWLSYNCPKFATKLLFGLLVCSMLIQIGLRSYQCGYRTYQDYISKGLSQSLFECSLRKKKKAALDNCIAVILRNSASRIDNAIEGYGFDLNIATTILLGLMLFAILIDNSKKKSPPQPAGISE
jgi:hypothetical protein